MGVGNQVVYSIIFSKAIEVDGCAEFGRAQSMTAEMMGIREKENFATIKREFFRLCLTVHSQTRILSERSFKWAESTPGTFMKWKLSLYVVCTAYPDKNGLMF